MKKYTNERNIQMLIYLLKENNIKKIIVNPGTMNMSFVVSVQSDPFFELYSCVDERSACYMACGLSTECNEPVVLTCTGATASRNYMPGLTEAFYRKLPILTITCTPHLGNIGHNIPQMIDRTAELKDTYKFSSYIPPIKSEIDEWSNNISINKAILELFSNDVGPVHINLGTEVTRVFDTDVLPDFRKISRINYDDIIPEIKNKKRIGIFVGNHKKWSEDLTNLVDQFCEKYNAVVICDHTSNYFGKYKILMNLICEQELYHSKSNYFDLIIHIGDTSGAYMQLNIDEVWRVNADGQIRDPFKKLSIVFEMKEKMFFEKYNNMVSNSKDTTLFQELKCEYETLEANFSKDEIGFSNVWIASETLSKLPQNSNLHLAILNTLRSWNYFQNSANVNCYCNTGGFGIDGMLSTLIGASLSKPDEIYFGVVGDLAFFYDINSLGNRHVNNNLRIMLINNGCGTEFHNYSHPASVVGQETISKYIAADGHFGNKSKTLVKNFCENLGFEYISADTKEEYLKNLEYFVSDKKYSKPIVFEIFTDSKIESDALVKMRRLKINTKEQIKSEIKKALPISTKNKLKKVLGK